MIVRRRPGLVPLVGSLNLPLIAVAAALATSWSSGISGVLSGGLILAAVAVELLRRPAARLPMTILLGILVVVYWTAEVLHPNVPGLEVGMLGWRKSCTFILAILLGVLWTRGRGSGLVAVWKLLVLTCLVSLIVHVAFPALEASVTRSADVSTAMIFGEVRMQGLLAGPFHVALAGTFLVLAGAFSWSKETSRRLCLLSIGVGSLCVYFAQVRTAYAVLVLGFIVAVFISIDGRKLRHTLLRLGFVAVGLIAGFELIGINVSSALGMQSQIIQSLFDARTDTRFTYRFETWREAFGLVRDSPIFGWGSGSAGDTLVQFFGSGVHVTSHNMLIKYAVEGGLVGLTLILGFFASVVRGIFRGGSHPLALAALVAIVGFGATGSTVEAIPVTVVLGVVIGISSSPKPRTKASRSEAQRSADI